jgi:hypothetical protein
LKKTAVAVALSVLAVLMVLPVVRSVNLSAGNPVTIGRTQYADGSPLAPSMSASTLMTDGDPLPPPIPPKPKPPSIDGYVLVADGDPLPPPIPPKPKPPQRSTLA